METESGLRRDGDRTYVGRSRTQAGLKSDFRQDGGSGYE